MSGLTLTQDDSDGSGVVTDARGDLWAHALGGNPLDSAWTERDRFEALIGDTDGPRRIIVWSGTLADELFADDPRSWLSGAADAFAEFIDSAIPALRSSGVRLLVRTHARHVLSDAPRCRVFASSRTDEPVGLLLDPASMLGRSMLAHAEVHFERLAADALPHADAVLISNVREDAAHGGDFSPHEKSDGLIEPSLLDVFELQDRVPAVRFARPA